MHAHALRYMISDHRKLHMVIDMKIGKLCATLHWRNSWAARYGDGRAWADGQSRQIGWQRQKGDTSACAQ